MKLFFSSQKNYPREETKHPLQLRCLKQKINTKPLKLLVQLMAHTNSLQLQLPKTDMIIISENRDIPSVHKLSWNAICKSLISLELSLGKRVFKHTVLYQRVRSNETLLEPKVNVNGHQIAQMLLGDGVNLLSKWLLKPYIFSATVAAREKNLSKNLSSTKITVEHVFRTIKVR